MVFAVHISDGVLPTAWWLGGFAVAVPLLWLAARRLRDDELPRIALLAAAAFISSSIHVPVPPTSIHLLLTGLLGVVLGARAPLAIAVGLGLQALLLRHGGFYSLGVNIAVVSLPALAAWAVFHPLQRLPWVRHRWFRSLLVLASAFFWFWSVVFSIAMLRENSFRDVPSLDLNSAWTTAAQPWLVGLCLAGAALVGAVERRFETAPEFPLGLLVGELAVLATVGLNCLVLMLAGSYWSTTALILVMAHLPLAVVEGVVLGFTVGFLAKVKPAMLRAAAPACPVLRPEACSIEK